MCLCGEAMGNCDLYNGKSQGKEQGNEEVGKGRRSLGKRRRRGTSCSHYAVRKGDASSCLTVQRSSGGSWRQCSGQAVAEDIRGALGGEDFRRD